MFGFEEIFGGGGFGGGGFGGGMPQRPKGDTTKLYKELGIEDTKCSQQEIRKAYRKLARQHHPDRGGDVEKFKRIQNAYDCLNDEQKRAAYDATGDPNGDPRALARARKRKGKTTKFELEVPMEQFYKGHTRKIRVTKTVLCRSCEGAGGSGVTTCSTCRGRGARIITRQIGPGMMQRMQAECNVCDGKGQVIPRGQRCNSCSATGLTKDSTILSVHIEKGMRHGDKVTFNEEGDQHPDTTPGDVVVILKKRPHKVFTRSPDGCHLEVKKQISLVEALTGFDFKINHLDGRVLRIQSRPGAIYKTGDVEALRDEGFPIRGDVTTHGHLYVSFTVVFPTSLDAKQTAVLKQVLGDGKPTPMSTHATDVDVEEVVLENVDIQAEKAAYAKLLADNPSQYDEDEDGRGGGMGGQEVQCRSQ
jgi:DnaJ family protein A protein 2